MTTEYVCSSCGHTFQAVRDPADGCPACGGPRQNIWSVGGGVAPENPRSHPTARPAADPLPRPAEAPHPVPPKRRSSRRAWPFGGWRLPAVALRLPAWPRTGTTIRRLDRRTLQRGLALGLLLAAWPFPLDDDRLPAPSQSRSAAGSPAVSRIADMLKASPTGPAAGTDARSSARPAETLTDPTPTRAPSAPRTDATRGVGAQGTAAATAPRRSATDMPAGQPSPGEASTGGAGRSAGDQVVGAPGGGQRPTAVAGRSPGGGSSASAPAVGAVAPVACVAAEDRRLVFVLDVSVSMGLPHGTDPELENRLDAAVDRGDAEALAQYRALLAQAGATSRLELARTAFGRALEATPEGIDVGVVSFHGCGDVRRMLPVTRPGFPSLANSVATLMWHRGGETALSEALQAAYAMTEGRTGRIAVITDGKDTCGPPPCRIIEKLQSANPAVRVDVVDVSGRSDAACLAVATGGSFRVAPLTGSADTFVNSVTALGRACPAVH